MNNKPGFGTGLCVGGLAIWIILSIQHARDGSVCTAVPDHWQDQRGAVWERLPVIEDEPRTLVYNCVDRCHNAFPEEVSPP